MAVGVGLGHLGEDRQVPAGHRDRAPLADGVGDEDPCPREDGRSRGEAPRSCCQANPSPPIPYPRRLRRLPGRVVSIYYAIFSCT